MDIAVFSDIHGNYVAFQKCLDYVLEKNIDTFIFWGIIWESSHIPRKQWKFCIT